MAHPTADMGDGPRHGSRRHDAAAGWYCCDGKPLDDGALDRGGFSPDRGGLLRLADQKGAESIVEAMDPSADHVAGDVDGGDGSRKCAGSGLDMWRPVGSDDVDGGAGDAVHGDSGEWFGSGAVRGCLAAPKP